MNTVEKGFKYVKHLPSVTYSNDYNRHNISHLASSTLKKTESYPHATPIYTRSCSGVICMKGMSNCDCRK